MAFVEFPDDDGVGLIEEGEGAVGLTSEVGGAGGLEEDGGAADGAVKGKQDGEEFLHLAPDGGGIHAGDGDIEAAGGVLQLVAGWGVAGAIPGLAGFAHAAGGVEGDAEAEEAGGPLRAGGGKVGQGPVPQRDGGLRESAEGEVTGEFGAEDGEVIGRTGAAGLERLTLVGLGGAPIATAGGGGGGGTGRGGIRPGCQREDREDEQKCSHARRMAGSAIVIARVRSVSG